MSDQVSQVIAKINEIDDSFVDFFRVTELNSSTILTTFLWTVHIDSLHPTVDFRFWNKEEKYEVEITVKKIESE
jgi:hypothetical protein